MMEGALQQGIYHRDFTCHDAHKFVISSIMYSLSYFTVFVIFCTVPLIHPRALKFLTMTGTLTMVMVARTGRRNL